MHFLRGVFVGKSYVCHILCLIRSDTQSSETWICDSSMLGKSSKHIIPNSGLMVTYHGTKAKNNP